MVVRRAAGRAPVAPLTLETPWRTFREVNLLLRERWSREVGSRDLSFSDFAALDLCGRAPARAAEVGRRIGVTAAGATDVIDRLEARHLVRRCPDPSDRRAVRIRVTTAGARLLERSNRTKETILRSIYAAMTPRERAALTEGLEALRRALDTPAGRA